MPINKVCAAYWAGFIAADGCITRTNKYKILKINLSDKDEDHLKLFKKHTKYTGKIYKYANNHNNFKTSIHISDKKFIQHIEDKFNIHPRKTFNLKPPKLITKKEQIAYMIGYIDGDGTIYKSGRRKETLTLSIVTASPFILSYFKKLIKNIIGVRLNISTAKYYKISISGHNAEVLYKILKNFKLPKLKRK